MNNKKVGVGFGLMLLRDGKVLLGRRHEDPAKADSDLHGEGSWTMPGGGMEYGESFEKTIIRELEEETSIKVKKEDLKLISITNDIGTEAHYITIGFLCEKFEGEAQVMEPDEITEWQWFDLNNLPDPVFSCSLKIVKNYLDKKIYKH